MIYQQLPPSFRVGGIDLIHPGSYNTYHDIISRFVSGTELWQKCKKEGNAGLSGNIEACNSLALICSFWFVERICPVKALLTVRRFQTNKKYHLPRGFLS